MTNLPDLTFTLAAQIAFGCSNKLYSLSNVRIESIIMLFIQTMNKKCRKRYLPKIKSEKREETL